jgi:integrase
MTSDEIRRVLAVCPLYQQLLLETAFLSGLRANELRSLTVDHLDLDKKGLRLEAEWTKNRKPGFQPLPEALVERLSVFALSSEPVRLYTRNYLRHDSTLRAPEKPLLYVQNQPVRALDKALEEAGIPKHTLEGKLDFHACRVAYISLIIESGVTVKEAQILARHATPQLTMNVYGRAREERLWKAVEQVAQTIRVTSVSESENGVVEYSAKEPIFQEIQEREISVVVGSSPTFSTYF